MSAATSASTVTVVSPTTTTSNSTIAPISTSNASRRGTVSACLASQAKIIEELSALRLFQDLDATGLTLRERLQLELSIVEEAKEKLARVNEMLDLVWQEFLAEHEGPCDRPPFGGMEREEEEHEEEEEEEEEGPEVFFEDVIAQGWFE